MRATEIHYFNYGADCSGKSYNVKPMPNLKFCFVPPGGEEGSSATSQNLARKTKAKKPIKSDNERNYYHKYLYQFFINSINQFQITQKAMTCIIVSKKEFTYSPIHSIFIIFRLYPIVENAKRFSRYSPNLASYWGIRIELKNKIPGSTRFRPFRGTSELFGILI